MNKEVITSRRNFITKTVPACAMTCMFSGSLLGMSLNELQEKPAQAKHKFDTVFGELTYRQINNMQTRYFINFAKYLEQNLGKEKAHELIKKFADNQAMNRGKAQASKAPDVGLQSYVKQFKEDPLYKNSLTMEIIQDTDKVFEMKITECITAETFLANKAADIGFVCVCQADHAWSEGFNPKIKLTRDKTILQGHGYCNHKYTLES